MSVYTAEQAQQTEDRQAGQTELYDHWHQLDGWNRHRALLACYLTFEDQPELHALIEAYQTPLKDLTQLDRIVPDWLHSTVQGIGFADEMPAGTAGRMGDVLSDSLLEVQPLRLVTGDPVAGGTGLYLPLSPTDRLSSLRTIVRSASRLVLGADAHDLPGQEGEHTFSPHVSFAYANDTISLEPIWERLATVDQAPVELTIHSLSMVMLHRDDQDRRWHWSELTHLEFGM